MSVSFSEAEPVNLWCRWRPLSCSFGAERFSDPGNMLRKCCMNMSPAEKHEEGYLRFPYKGLNRWPIRRECAYREAGLKGTWAPRIVWGWGWTWGITYGAAVRWTSCSDNRNITSPIVRSQNNDRDLCFKLSQASSWLAVLMNESDFTKKILQHLSSVMNIIPFCEYRRESSRIMSSLFLWMVLIGQFRWTGRLSLTQ